MHDKGSLLQTLLLMCSVTLSIQQDTVTVGKMGTSSITSLPDTVHSVVANSLFSEYLPAQNVIDENQNMFWRSQDNLYNEDGTRDYNKPKEGVCINLKANYTLVGYHFYDSETKMCISGSLTGKVTDSPVTTPQVSDYDDVATWANATWTYNKHLVSPQNFQSDIPFNVICYTCEVKEGRNPTDEAPYPTHLSMWEKIGRAHV